MVLAQTADGTYKQPGGLPPGSGSVCWAFHMDFPISQVKDPTKQEDGRTLVSLEGVSSERWILESGSGFLFLDPRR